MNTKILFVWLGFSTYILANNATNERERERLASLQTQHALYAQNNTTLSETDSPLTSKPTQSADTDTNADEQKIQKVQLDKVTATADKDYESYQSGAQIGRNILQASPSGNGDITSILRILPNVQFDNTQLRSNTPGEIDPANVSISGGLYYQNNFLLDGMNMNNDLDPIGMSANNPTANGTSTLRAGRSQGLAVDTSLLDSITVLDSNVSAAYGKFTGGVVEAQVRKPRKDDGGIKGWHANVSYQITQGNANPKAISLTHYFIHEDAQANFATSSNESYQPQFHKHSIKSSVEGYVKENLGLVASFNTTQSFIPLYAYDQSLFSRYQGNDYNRKKDQRRQIYNYFLKAFYTPNSNTNIEASIAYMPQDNTYFNNSMRDSYYTMKSGGWQLGLKAVQNSHIGILTNSLSYSFMEHSRKSDSNVWRGWYHSEDKNWALNTSYVAMEGGYGDMDELQHSVNYKVDMAFEPISFWKITQNFRVGADLSYQYINKERLNPYYRLTPWDHYSGNVAIPSIKNLNGGYCWDSLGLDSCSTGTVLNGAGVGWSGQFFTYLYEEQVNSINLDNLSYGLFAENDINIDLNNGGELNARIGLRFDGDSYMSKKTLAPRLSLNYITPAPKQWSSKITLGANRYYGRSLYSYRLYDLVLDSVRYYTRDLDPITNTPTAWIEETNFAQNGSSSYLFRKLKIPYSDELMAGINQELSVISIALKFIYRFGRDEIMRVSRRTLNLPTQEGYTSSYATYSNDGKSESSVISLSIQNAKNLSTAGINHFLLFAFDYTTSNRTYNPQTSDDAYYNNQLIKYNGEVIGYRDRPVENFVRPYTFRLTTTHNFNFGRTKWLLNNFFRLRSGYDKMVYITQRSHPNLYDPNFRGAQYAKMRFKPSFSWDMRVGFEANVRNDHTVYMNVDIFNVLNTKNMTTLGLANGNDTTSLASSSSVPVYELGRQFWVQVGYKF